MRKIIIICVAYDRDISLRVLIDSFLLQSNPNWCLYVIHDYKASDKVKRIMDIYSDHRIMFFETENRTGCYGHINRRDFLKKLPACDDFVLMTNDDNYYTPDFVKMMLSVVTDNIGIVYCDTVHNHYEYNLHHSVLKENGIDMGAFIVRLDIAKQVGFNHTHFSADGRYAEECHRACTANKLTVMRIPKPLFIHN